MDWAFKDFRHKSILRSDYRKVKGFELKFFETPDQDNPGGVSRGIEVLLYTSRM
jgi:hypothetical protein